MVEGCLFCGIVEGSVPATTVYEDADAMAFEDINPQAPTHVLVIPRTHYADIVELAEHPTAAATLVQAIAAVAKQLELSDFRTVFNTGAGVGQSVFHVHAHVLAGRPMTWPPG
jgi:histidine triad (HIT) family protein